MNFEISSSFSPTGDQPEAIAALSEGIKSGVPFQTLLGVTGSGKTFTIANVIKEVQRPTLILSHNKTLAAQLYSEFKAFFPNNAVEYFVSYYDYYQTEAYLPSSDTYIEKDLAINDEIDKLLTSYFSNNPVLTRGDFQGLCNFTSTTASRHIKRLKEEKKLKNINSYYNPIYVPMPGYYGKEEIKTNQGYNIEKEN